MFSLVIPVYNEEPLIEDLVNRVVASVEAFAGDYELLFVDDGSTDGTVDKLLQHRHINKKIKIISLSKILVIRRLSTAGLELSTGEIVAMMDGDLQDPPELLADMYRKISAEGFDIVSGKEPGARAAISAPFTLSFFISFLKILPDWNTWRMPAISR